MLAALAAFFLFIHSNRLHHFIANRESFLTIFFWSPQTRLAENKTVRQSGEVRKPDLQALQHGDAAAWDEAFVWLWPAAFGAAKVVLSQGLAHEAEDTAIEAIEELIEKVGDLQSADELKPLVASIAHHRAVSRLRAHFAAKRGSGRVESLEAHEAETGNRPEGLVFDSPLAALEQKELAKNLGKLLAELKPPQGEILADFFVHGRSYDEIAKKHGLAMGSVGVYLKRGLETLRRAWPGKEDR